MKRSLALVTVIALCGVAYAAGWLEVKPDKENVVASRLIGKWEIDVQLTKRLADRARAGLTIAFTDEPAAIEKLNQAKFGKFLGNKRVYLAGKMSIGAKTAPYLLTTHSGNPYVFFFRPRGGDPLGDSESFSLMIARGATPKQDLLFIGGDFNNQPFMAFRRAGAAKAAKPGKADLTTPEGVVRAWIAAAKAQDKTAMLALGTEAWKKKELSWNRSFTSAIFTMGFKLVSCDVRPASIEGDTARVSCSAKFLDPKGKEDGEGLRFKLKKIDGVWKIIELG